MSSSHSIPPLFTSFPLPPLPRQSHQNVSIPTKYSLRSQRAQPISPPVPHRRAPPPPAPTHSTRKTRRFNALLSPLNEPERLGLWTVLEDPEGEREAENEGYLRARRKRFDLIVGDWGRGVTGPSSLEEVDDRFEFTEFEGFEEIELGLETRGGESCDTSCTEEDCGVLTPVEEVNDPLDDIFKNGQWTRKAPYEEPPSPTSSEESFSSFYNATRPAIPLFTPSTLPLDQARRPPPLDLKNNPLWRQSINPFLPVLGSPFSPSPAPTSTEERLQTGLASPFSEDLVTPKHQASFALTSPPALSRSSRSSSTSSGSSRREEPITPSPGQSHPVDLLSATFERFLLSAEEDPRGFMSMPEPKSGVQTGFGFPLPPFRMEDEQPRTPTEQIMTGYRMTSPPGAPKRPTREGGPAPPSSITLQRAMGMTERSKSNQVEHGRSPPAPPKPNASRSRSSAPRSSAALQGILGMKPLAPSLRTNKSSTSACSMTSSLGSTSSSSSTSSRKLPTRSPLPKEWLGYQPQSNRI